MAIMAALSKDFEEYSEEAKKQWNESCIEDYRFGIIKSCANCDIWCEHLIDRLYERNPCSAFPIDKIRCDFVMTKFDMWCPNYVGIGKRENLLYVEEWEERKNDCK